MNKSIPLIMLVLICLVFSVSSWTPQSDIDLRNHYSIYNGTDINSTEFYQDGNKVVDESSIVNLSTNYSTYSNNSGYWNGYNNASDLNNRITIQGENITGGTIAFARLPNLTNRIISHWANITNKFITAVDGDYIYMDGTTATFNETKSNNTGDIRYIQVANEGDLNTNHSNSTSYWLGYNLVSQLNYRILSYWLNITNRPTHLSNFTDNLGDRGYTVLSNFTDDLGDRGYDSLSNFTNDIDLINSTYGNDTYILQSSESSLNVSEADKWGNLDSPDDFKNTTVSEYMFGQPIEGSIGSGIIYTSEYLDVCGCTNVTANSGLELHYPDITIRVVCIDGTESYCDISEGDLNVTDDQHTVYYLNSSCDILSDTFSNYYGGDILPANRARVFDVFTLNGVIEEVKGATVLQLADLKSRQISVLCSECAHLSVCDGFDITQDTAFAINVSSGHLVYLNTYLPTDAKSSLVDGLHLTHHTSGDWVHTNITGLNITHCDNGTDLVACTGAAYRQYPVYSLNWDADTIIHQLSPLLSDATFANLAACTEADPYYSLPASEEYVAVVHHIYCAKRTDSVWDSDGWKDLRAEPSGAGGSPDLSIYLLKDATRALTNPWDAGQNITAPWFLGLFNWEISSDSTNWLNFNGSHLSFNTTHANDTYAPINYGDDWNKTYADTLYYDISNPTEFINSSYGNDTYRLQSWDNFTGIPTATPSDGDTTHLSTADQIRDYVIGLNYFDNIADFTGTLTDTKFCTYDGTSGEINCTNAGAGGDQWSDPVDSSIIPDTDNTYDLGNSSHEFKDAYFDGTVTTDAVSCSGAMTSTSLDTGQGAYELYAMNQDVESTDAVTFATVNTGQGAYELYAMNQDVESTDAVTFATVDTGQGSNELYDMDQNVQTSDAVTFDNATISTQLTVETIIFEGNSTHINITANSTHMIFRSITSELRLS